MDPLVMLLILAVLVVMGRKPRDPSAGAAAVVLLLVAAPVRAIECPPGTHEEPFDFNGAAAVRCAPDVPIVVEPSPEAAFKVRGYTWSQVLLTKGEERVPVFGARAQVSLTVWRVTFAQRLDVSALKSGVTFEDPETYSSIESYTLLAVDVAGPVALAGVWGETTPALGEDGPRQRTRFGGALVGDGTGDRWILVGLGEHEAAGKGLRAIAAWQMRLRDRTSFVGDAVIGDGWMVRAGLALRVQ